MGWLTESVIQVNQVAWLQVLRTSVHGSGDCTGRCCSLVPWPPVPGPSLVDIFIAMA